MLYLDIYGVRIGIFYPSDIDLRQSLQSFRFFHAPPSAHLDIEIHIKKNAILKQKRIPLFRFRGADVRGFNERQIIYSHERSVVLSKKNECQVVHLYEADSKYINDLVYVTLNSMAGWALERKGWIRLHGVSYPSEKGAVAVVGDSGIGKSGYALKKIRCAQEIFSDEITLIAPDGRVYPWPIPIQIDEVIIQLYKIDRSSLALFPKRNHRQKWQHAIAPEQIAEPINLHRIETPHSLPGIIFRVTFGLGLPQILEYQLRPDNLFAIVFILIRRFIFIVKLKKSGRLLCNRPSLKT